MAECLKLTPEKVGTADVGIVGIGVMGSNLALNILDKGITLAVWNYETEWAVKFLTEHCPKYGESKLLSAETYEDFAQLLKKPRKTLILVTAGKATDMVIENLSRVFEAEDVIVDTGNAHFRDQSKRAAELEAKGLRFLGMGVSGGAEGARKGPAFFPGGTLTVWQDIQPIVEAVAAKAKDGRPCVTMCGSGGAGSCVKMYHNAGEYAVLQLWAEAYSCMRSLGLKAEAIQKVLKDWKAKGDLESYMLDITIEVAGKVDSKAADRSYLVDHTADMIGSKGTGLWSVQEALGVGCPVPSLAAAVLCRQMSMVKPERVSNASRIGEAIQASASAAPSEEESAKLLEDLYWATYLSIVASYAQMFQAIRAIDKEFKMDISDKLPRIISTFRAGCILQGAMLEPMTKAFEADPNIPNLMCAFQEQFKAGMPGLRATIARIAMGGEPCPVMQASLDYIVTMTQPLIRAGQVVSLQRDVFGRHGFKRIEDDGKVTEASFNEEWPEMVP